MRRAPLCNPARPRSPISSHPAKIVPHEGVIHAKSVRHSESVTSSTQASPHRTRSFGYGNQRTSRVNHQQRIGENPSRRCQTAAHDVCFRSEEDCSRSKGSLGSVENKAEESSLAVIEGFLAQEPAPAVEPRRASVSIEGTKTKRPACQSPSGDQECYLDRRNTPVDQGFPS
jgi:hypothetical protein